MKYENLGIELTVFFVTTNLVAFALGILLAVVQFDVNSFVTGIEIYLLPAILFGIGALVYWGYRLVRAWVAIVKL